MTPTATTRTAAVIGNPVRHSLSPIIHNAGFKALDLDWTYVAFDIAPGCAGDALEAMRTLRLGGLSVTMPHKADVALSVDQLTPQAELLQAVNCVAWDQGELVGHNTDGAGFVDNLVAETGVALGGKTCAVLGAGGAARAIVLALAEAGVAKVAVINRTKSKAIAAAELAGDAGYSGSPEDAASADIVVNATPMGMAGTPEAGLFPLRPELLRADQIVAELVYHPARTPFLEAAAAAGATAVEGIGMLVHQAAHQFSLWTGAPAPVDTMFAAASEAIGLDA